MVANAPSARMWGSQERADRIAPVLRAREVSADADQTRTAAEDESAGRPALPPPPHRLSAPLQRRDPDRYEMLGEHGRGGLGTVTRAHDRELGRNVAIKELIKRGDAGEIRFLREAMITARLEHPGIVPVHEAGQWPDGTPFYVMKLVAGRSLKETIAKCGSVADRMALLHHVVAVADAVAYAHKRKIIHRDLKPANVIVGDFGETVVIDWGLAKDLSELDDVRHPDERGPYRAPAVEDLTEAGSILGTPMYMAPEQWRGERVDQRADVFAIGAMLWELCSKHRVPPAEPRQRDRMLRRGNIDGDLIAIIGKALASDPADRYQNAGELASDLRAFTSGARIASRRYSAAGVLVHWIRHHRAISAIGAAAVVLGAIGAAIYVRNIGIERDRAEKLQIATRDANDELVLQNAELLMQRDPSAVVDVLAGYRGKDTVRKDRLLAEARGRGVAEARFTAHSDSVHFLYGDADGSIYSLGEDGRLVVTRNGTSIPLATDASTSPAYAFAADERVLAFATSPSGIALVDLENHTTTRIDASRPIDLSISADASLVAALDPGRELTVWKLPGKQVVYRATLPDAISVDVTGTTLYVHEQHGQRSISFASSPPVIATRTGKTTAFDGGAHQHVIGDREGRITLLDGSLAPQAALVVCRTEVTAVRLDSIDRFAFGCAEGRAGVARLDRAANNLTIEHAVDTPGRVSAAQIDETGRRLIAVAQPTTIVVVDLETKLSSTLRGQPALVLAIAVPRVELDRILTGDSDGNIRVWRPQLAAGARRLLRSDGAVFGVAVSPDGATVAADGLSAVVRRVDLATGTTTDLEGHTGLVFRTRFAPEGRTFLSMSNDGTVRVWDPRESTAVRVFAGHRGRINDAEYTARGDRVVTAGDDGQLLAWSTHGTDVEVRYSHDAPLGTHEVLAHNDHVVANDSDGLLLDIAPDGSVRRIGAPGTDTVTLLRASASGRLVAVGRASGSVTVYDTTTYRVVHQSKLAASIHQIQFDPQERDLVIQSEGGSVRIVSLDDRRQLPWREIAMRARDAAYSADGERLGFVCANGTWFYSVRDDRWMFTEDHAHTPLSGRFAPSGHRFFSADATGVVVVRDL